jgi:hypothetical protein
MQAASPLFRFQALEALKACTFAGTAAFFPFRAKKTVFLQF